MHLLPIRTPLLKEGDNLCKIIADASAIEEGDIIALSSKAVAMVEGNLIDLNALEVSDEAKLRISIFDSEGEIIDSYE